MSSSGSDSTAWLARAQRLAKRLTQVEAPPPRGAAAQPPRRSKPALALAERLLGRDATVVIDVGARQVGDLAEVMAQRREGDHSADAWWRLHPVAALVGFEPDEQECLRLNAHVPEGRSERYLPTALGKSKGMATLHQAIRPACSSLYPPDPGTLSRYPQVFEDIREIGTQEVALTTLDDWWMDAGKPRVSFVKLDTQGSELDILVAGQAMLAGCLGLELEVEFNTMYAGQPLFHEVDRFLRGLGFSLWRLLSLCHYAEKPLCRRAEPDAVHFDGKWYKTPSGSGRLFWGNAVYFRDHVTISDNRELLILGALLEGLGDLDGAAACLKRAPFTETQPVIARLEQP